VYLLALSLGVSFSPLTLPLATPVCGSGTHSIALGGCLPLLSLLTLLLLSLLSFRLSDLVRD
jgi:hypothetical protein